MSHALHPNFNHCLANCRAQSVLRVSIARSSLRLLLKSWLVANVRRAKSSRCWVSCGAINVLMSFTKRSVGKLSASQNSCVVLDMAQYRMALLRLIASALRA